MLSAAIPGLEMVSFSRLPACAAVSSPDVFGLSIAYQKYVEAKLLVREILNTVPLQTEAADALVIEGAGFTITVEVIAFPIQFAG